MPVNAELTQKPVTNDPQIPAYGNRADGTPKGFGYFGEVKARNGKNFSTELSAEADIDGEKISYPLMHPNISHGDLTHLVNGGKPTPAMHDAAIEHAMLRQKRGLSPFATADEAPLPLPQPVVDPLMAIRAQVKQKRGY